jgi:hypothetical protein
MTAALDAARLGARVPLSADLLRAAAVDYCTSAQQAEAPDNWFEQAWLTPPKSCTAPPPRSAPPRRAWTRSPGTRRRTT